MLAHFGIESIRAEWQTSVVCIGTFDGVHLGHRRVIGEAVRQSHEIEAPSVVVTFDRHPTAILAPEKCPPKIASLERDLHEFAALGAAVCVVMKFDRTLADTCAADFFNTILVDSLHAGKMVVGHDFAFGHDRVGTPAWLSERIPTTVVPAFEVDGARVASSTIRTLVAMGDVEAASRLLGRPFSIEAVVIGGQKLGRTLGFPTINLARSIDQVIPANGVYAGSCETPFGTFLAAVGIGVRPAVGGGPRTIEAFLLDYPGAPLYGCAVRLSLLRRLRDEHPFETMEELTAQMVRDVEAVRGL